MSEYKHSVLLDVSKCKGCTNCLKHCPTEAIRIRSGHAAINPARCIDCGECIRICPYKAKKSIYDYLDKIDRFKYKIALPAPALYGQFDNLDDIDYVIQGLYDMGFDHVYEVARTAELVSDYTRKYLSKPGIKKPVISSACPAIVRLISLRFPFLCDNIMPILSPVELAARFAKKEALEKHPELRPDDIVTCFISPCPAKVSYVNNSTADFKSEVDLVLSMSDVYFALLDRMKKRAGTTPEKSTETGMVGVSWASTGGEASAIFNDRYLAADGIENVIRVLEQIDNSEFPNLEFIELDACNGGCVGGVLTVANPYIAKARLQSLKRYMPVTQSFKYGPFEDIPDGVKTDPVEYIPYSPFGADRSTAIKKMNFVQTIYERLPKLDCGSCGAPTCAAFAEDIVKGEASEDDCIVHMRQKIKEFYQLLKEEND